MLVPIFLSFLEATVRRFAEARPVSPRHWGVTGTPISQRWSRERRGVYGGTPPWETKADTPLSLPRTSEKKVRWVPLSRGCWSHTASGGGGGRWGWRDSLKRAPWSQAQGGPGLAGALRLPPARFPPGGWLPAAKGGAVALPSGTLRLCPPPPLPRRRPGRRSGGACGGEGGGACRGRGGRAGSRRPGRRSDWAGRAGCAGSRAPRRQHPPPPPLFLFFPSASFFSFSFFPCPVPRSAPSPEDIRSSGPWTVAATTAGASSFCAQVREPSPPLYRVLVFLLPRPPRRGRRKSPGKEWEWGGVVSSSVSWKQAQVGRAVQSSSWRKLQARPL